MIMKQGKKSTAEHIFYDAMDIIAKKTNEEPLKVFTKAVDNVKPVVEVKSRRVGSDVSGAGRRAARQARGSGPALAHFLRPRPLGPDDGGKVCERAHRRIPQHRQCRERT